MNTNVVALGNDFSTVLKAADGELDLARASLGIKPDLAEARKRAHGANAALHQAVELIRRSSLLEATIPDDVIARVGRFQDDLTGVYAEIEMCERVVAARQLVRPANHLMN